MIPAVLLPSECGKSRAHSTQVHAVHADNAFRWNVESRNQADRRRLSRARRTHERGHRSRLRAEGNVAQNVVRSVVAESHMVELDRAYDVAKRHGALWVLIFRPLPHDFLRALQPSQRLG